MKDSRLWQRHFSEEDIGGNEKQRVLKRNAVPTLNLLSKKRFDIVFMEVCFSIIGSVNCITDSAMLMITEK